jgi:hypothetical protein
MGRLVDQAGGPGDTTEAESDAEAETDETTVTGESDAQDIESELYSSTREAGIAAAGFAPMPDA